MGRQQMTGMDDVERQTTHGDTDIQNKKTKAARDCQILCIAVIFTVLLIVCFIFPLEYFREDTHYFAKIDSASDLSPKHGVSFNFTLGVASHSYGSKACIEHGTLYSEVYYHGVQLAASETDVGPLCAGPRKTAEQRVNVRATTVPVGHVLERLTVDMKQGAAVFDIRMYLPPGSYGVGDADNLECKGSRVGGPSVWCDAPVSFLVE